MESKTAKMAWVVLLLSAIVMLATASADSGYGKSQLEGYVPKKPATPKENERYVKPDPKLPTEPVIPKEEHGAYEKTKPVLPTKPVIPKEEVGGYEKTKPVLPTKPVIPKEEHGGYEKTKPILPTMPVIPKEEHGGYEKTKPILPTKPVISKEEHGGYKKTKPILPTKPVIPKEEHGGYEKARPILPTKPVIPKEQRGYEKTKPILPTKPVISKEEQERYEMIKPTFPTKPVVPKMDHESYEKNYPKVPEHPKNIAVQGLIYCKYGSKLLPLQGATARVSCLAVHKNGYESAPFSFSSCPADEKGYFLAKIPSSTLVKDDLWEITKCKAFLEKSPWTSCNVPEDTNGGIKGAPLTFSRHLNSDGYCLSSVGPFIFNPGKVSLPKEGY